MPTRANIRDWAREQTLIETDDFPDDKINAILDQGVRDVATKFDWPFLAKSDSITLVQDQEGYALPADMGKLRAMVLDGTNVRLREIAPTTAWENEGATPAGGAPRTFFIWGSNVVFRPVPDAAGTVTVYYHKTPTLLANDTSEPEWDAQFHLILADFAAQHMWEREEEFEKAQIFANRYAAGVESMARFYLNRAADSPLVYGYRPYSRKTGPVFPWQTV